MADQLRQQIKKKQPFSSGEQEAFLNLVRTVDALQRQVEEVLKPAGLSATQYNALRILRGAGPEGLACGDVGERMITRDPDITRLMDRLEKNGLVKRSRCEVDRRVVTARITEKGLKALAALDEPILRAHKAQLGHLGKEKLRTLVELLEEAREPKRATEI